MKNLKKIVSILLAVAMLTAMLAFGVSADTENVFGGNTGVAPDDYPKTDPNKGHNLNVKVTEVQHRYAVDVEFGIQDLTLGTATWDVENMKYKFSGTLADDTTQKVTVFNRSDLPVKAYATITNLDENSGIVVTADKTVDSKVEVKKATAPTSSQEGAKGTAGSADINLTIKTATGKSWDDVTTYYVQEVLKKSETTNVTFTIATVTVYISKD